MFLAIYEENVSKARPVEFSTFNAKIDKIRVVRSGNLIKSSPFSSPLFYVIV